MVPSDVGVTPPGQLCLELISIPASHYCERARWALDYAGLVYTERKWPPLMHTKGLPALADTRSPPASALGNSSHALMGPGPLDKATAPQQRKLRTVPVLRILPAQAPASPTASELPPAGATDSAPLPYLLGGSGELLLTDSSHIVLYAEQHLRRQHHLYHAASSPSSPPPPPCLYPSDPAQRSEALRLEALFTAKLGVWTRVIAYHALFSEPPPAGPSLAVAVLGGMQPGMEAWKQEALRAAYPEVRRGVSSGLRVSAEGAAACLARTRALLAEVGEVLAEAGRQGRGAWLVGGAFTAADMTFAAMVAVMVLPGGGVGDGEGQGGEGGTQGPGGHGAEGCGGCGYGAWLPPLASWPRAYRDLVAEVRGKAAGQHALKVYREHRWRCGPTAWGSGEEEGKGAGGPRPGWGPGGGAGVEQARDVHQPASRL